MHVVATSTSDSHNISDAAIGGNPSIFTLICSGYCVAIGYCSKSLLSVLRAFELGT